jgi:hypothetical protein
MPEKYDWEQGFQIWAGLPVGERNYDRVAEELGCRVRAVERASVRHGWQDRIRRIDAKAREQADKRLVRDRAERVADTLRIIDASRTKFAGQLGRADFRLTGSDFVGLVKLEQLLEGEATDNIGLAVVQAGFRESMNAAVELLTRLLERGLQGPALLATFKRELPGVVQERLAIVEAGA